MRLVLDMETASEVDLRTAGVHRYAADPGTKITVICYALDKGPVRTWTGGPCPDDLRAAILAGCVVVSHNYMFEMTMWDHKLRDLGFPPVALGQWSCTMARALVAGLPASLDLCGVALNLPIKKDKAAHGLMLRFARPRSLDPLIWWHETDPERFAELMAYCARDVEAERYLDAAVPELTPAEYAVFLADHRINQRGLRVDLALVRQMKRLAESEKARINTRLNMLTNGRVTSAAQVMRLVAWLEDNQVQAPTRDPGDGTPPRPTLGRAAVEGMLLGGGLPPHAEQVLWCRRDASRSSTAKLNTVLNSVSADDRLRGTTQYYGANRTGRWAGRRFQPQNLPRGTIHDIPGAVALIERDCSAEDLEMLWSDSPMGVLASCLRSVIEAAPGKLLVSCDFSQIEARVLVWLAGQDDVTAIFARGEDVYTYTANRLGSDNRQLGKVLVLACGFGMGPVRFRATAAGFGVVLSEVEAEDAVTGWRALNSRVVHFWWEAHKAAMRVAGGAVGGRETLRGITFARRPDSLDARLPGGRTLVYRDPRVERHPEHGHLELTYRGVEQGRWARARSWPGKLTENLVQAIARDVMADALVSADRRGVPLVATVHDELVAEIEADRAPALRDWLMWRMNQPVVWAPGLPVAAAATIGRRYRKDA